jgi:septal ring factor EnvC (AmiA/AmiB activator)
VSGPSEAGERKRTKKEAAAAKKQKKQKKAGAQTEKFGGILADDMGLGKTSVFGRVFGFCPVRLQWRVG